MENKKVKINYVRWELVPVYNEKYVDEEVLKEINNIEDDDERCEFIEDLLNNENEFIWTSQDTNWDSPDYNGELDKFYIKSNEHSIYISSSIQIDNTTISKDFDENINKDINKLKKEYNSLTVYDVKSIIRDRKLRELGI